MQWTNDIPTDDNVGQEVLVRHAQGDENITYHIGTVVDISLAKGAPSRVGLRGIRIVVIDYDRNTPVATELILTGAVTEPTLYKGILHIPYETPFGKDSYLYAFLETISQELFAKDTL